MEIGFRTIPNTSPARYRFYPQESLMLTGDEQIVDAQIIVQYKVKDPEKFLFNVKGLEKPQGALMDAAEVALRQVVGQRPIDDVLITQKLQIESDIHQLLQRIIDRYDSGVRITAVKLQTVRPPEEVKKAFSDVVSAKEDKERMGLSDHCESCICAIIVPFQINISGQILLDYSSNYSPDNNGVKQYIQYKQ
ncbi:hypothetical protein ES703_39826 [subsurface metagenome]